MRLILTYAFLLALSIYLSVWSINKHHETKEYCGVVITKEAYPEYASKHGNYRGVEHSMVVKFNEIGYQTISVSTNCYYNSKAGENICFDLQRREYEDTHVGWFTALGTISIMAALALSFTLIFHVILFFNPKLKS